MLALFSMGSIRGVRMTKYQRVARGGAAALLLVATAACANTGGLGNILGSVLGGNQGGQVSGSVRGLDTRTQQIAIQQSNGQTVALEYDNRTQVVYQNQNYPVNSLEYGDQVTARVASTSNNAYYTDYIQVDQSVSNTTGGSSGNVQQVQGNVRQIDYANGLFTVNSGNGILTVSMPYNARRQDITTFQNLRQGDYVRFYGIYLNNSRVELRQFY
jgi:exosome complex RNA-binding protein Csl4